MTFSFWKYHGLGNDFIIVDGRRYGLEWPVEFIRQLCDRHTGIGADGLLLLDSSENADFRLIIYNADGTRPEMCGNGLRCFAAYLFERGLTTSKNLYIETDRGVLRCELFGDESHIDTVRVDMGEPILNPSQIPLRSDLPAFIESELEIAGRSLIGTAVSMGNPHFVMFDGISSERTQLAPQIEGSENFPLRVNVEFVEQIDSKTFQVVVYERGCGFTQACGTGACAVGVAAVLTERAQFGEELEIRQPGGSLWITIPEDLSTVWMRGASQAVFEGVYHGKNG